MISPEEIRKKAERAYPQMLGAWAKGEIANLFPLAVRASLSPVRGDLAATQSAIARLRDGSKEESGSGYTVHWTQIRSRDFGNNRFPERITIDTVEDLLSLAQCAKHFATTCEVVRRIRDRLPGLDEWIVSHIRVVGRLAESLEGLLAVTQFFLDHPRPDCYARQIPVAVDTKFVERHQQVLREWLDELLPASAIQAVEKRFPLRYGLRDSQPHTTVRILDRVLQEELSLPFDELSLPLRSLAKLPVQNATVIIVENRLNLLTLPSFRRGIAIRGEGKAVTRLLQLPWLNDNEIIYWGDVDVEGFQILAAFRRYLPDVSSILMDELTLTRLGHLAGDGNGKAAKKPCLLTADELAAFRTCVLENRRLEQERIPQPEVEQAFTATLARLPDPRARKK